jgi:hypothetical protein
MAETSDKLTITSMAVIAGGLAVLLHEGLGHGVTAWLRGDIPTELTSNHLSSMRADHWVEAAGTLVNIAVGLPALAASRGKGSANWRYFFWLLGALNLLPAAGYFMLSGLAGFGDWYEVVAGLPHLALIRVAMTLAGAAAYYGVAWMLARTVTPWSHGGADYNTIGRLPYYVAGAFSCVAGAFDPLGVKLMLISTIPAAFGGSSGLMWANYLIPRGSPGGALVVTRQTGWWIAAVIWGVTFIAVLGRGVHFAH